jgi:hypothetical protein
MIIINRNPQRNIQTETAKAEMLVTFTKNGILRVEFADPSGECRILPINAGIFRGLGNLGGIFKNQPKL